MRKGRRRGGDGGEGLEEGHAFREGKGEGGGESDTIRWVRSKSRLAEKVLVGRERASWGGVEREGYRSPRLGEGLGKKGERGNRGTHLRKEEDGEKLAVACPGITSVLPSGSLFLREENLRYAHL